MIPSQTKIFAGSWNRVYKSDYNLQVFEHRNTKRLAIADQSGSQPHLTDDGTIWIDKSLPITLGGKYGCHLPVIEEGQEFEGMSTTCTYNLACFLNERYGFQLKVGDKYILNVDKDLSDI